MPCALSLLRPLWTIWKNPYPIITFNILLLISNPCTSLEVDLLPVESDVVSVRIIQEMLQALAGLHKAIKSALSLEKVRIAQESFTMIVEEAMQAYRARRVQVDLRALPEVMYNWAVVELPLQARNTSNYPRIQQQLELFKNIIDHLLYPREIT